MNTKHTPGPWRAEPTPSSSHWDWKVCVDRRQYIGIDTNSAEADARLIANPNCSTIILLTALNPLRERFVISKIVVSTYQAVSGAGLEAIAELKTQARAILDNQPANHHLDFRRLGNRDRHVSRRHSNGRGKYYQCLRLGW
jgi:hypothetical protein